MLTAGQVSDHKGAAALLEHLPHATVLIVDKGYDSDAFRKGLIDKGIKPCIPPLKHRKVQNGYDRNLYRQRHKIENLFARIKDWRRVHTRYDRCAHTFLSAITLTATVLFWL